MSFHIGKEGVNYKVVELLGQGGFGKVYRGIHLESGRNVAIKALDIESMIRARMKDRVNEEVSIHSRLEHPSIVEFLDVFQDAVNVYIILQHCPNGDLNQYLKKHGKCVQQEARNIFQQIIHGVLYLHKHLIVHRDLTLANILLDQHFQIKITDFGLATQMRQRNEIHTTMCGTPVSIAPEVVTRKPHGPEADVWGLGCILYTLLVGVSPFETEGVRNTMKRVVMDNPTLPSYLSLESQDLITKMLQKDPNSRIKLVDILEHPFFKSSAPSSNNWDSGMCTMTTTNTLSGPEMKAPLLSGLTEVPEVQRSSVRSSLKSTRSLLRQRSWSEVSSQRAPISRSHKSLDDEDVSESSTVKETKKKEIRETKDGLDLSSPIKSNRLRPTSKKQPLKVGTASILPNNSIQLEFKLGKNGNSTEVFSVTSDGMNVTITSTKGGIKQFNYDALPKNYWQKYNYAARYVNFVKEKTPKITYFSDNAKCHLMENGPVSSFEALFYCHGVKISFSSVSGIILYRNNVEMGAYSYPLSLQDSHEFSDNLKHFEDCHTRCKRIEDLLSTNERYIGGSVFPITIGKKPTSLSNVAEQDLRTERMTSNSMKSITSFKSDRTTKVDFDDDTAIELGPEDEIKYYRSGVPCPVSTESLPEEVRQKLAQIDTHIKLLRNCKP